MTAWECAVGGCGRTFGDLEGVLAHQVSSHGRHECRVCGTAVPEGFFAIYHLFTEHNRTAYVRHYDGDADDIREREAVLDAAGTGDVEAIRERLLGPDDGDAEGQARAD